MMSFAVGEGCYWNMLNWHSGQLPRSSEDIIIMQNHLCANRLQLEQREVGLLKT